MARPICAEYFDLVSLVICPLYLRNNDSITMASNFYPRRSGRRLSLLKRALERMIKDKIIVVARIPHQTDKRIRYKRHPSFTHPTLEIPAIHWMQSFHAENPFENETETDAALDRLEAFLKSRHLLGEFADQWKSFHASNQKKRQRAGCDATSNLTDTDTPRVKRSRTGKISGGTKLAASPLQQIQNGSPSRRSHEPDSSRPLSDTSESSGTITIGLTDSLPSSPTIPVTTHQSTTTSNAQQKMHRSIRDPSPGLEGELHRAANPKSQSSIRVIQSWISAVTGRIQRIYPDEDIEIMYSENSESLVFKCHDCDCEGAVSNEDNTSKLVLAHIKLRSHLTKVMARVKSSGGMRVTDEAVLGVLAARILVGKLESRFLKIPFSEVYAVSATMVGCKQIEGCESRKSTTSEDLSNKNEEKRQQACALPAMENTPSSKILARLDLLEFANRKTIADMAGIISRDIKLQGKISDMRESQLKATSSELELISGIMEASRGINEDVEIGKSEIQTLRKGLSDAEGAIHRISCEVRDHTTTPTAASALADSRHLNHDVRILELEEQLGSVKEERIRELEQQLVAVKADAISRHQEATSKSEGEIKAWAKISAEGIEVVNKRMSRMEKENNKRMEAMEVGQNQNITQFIV